MKRSPLKRKSAFRAHRKTAEQTPERHAFKEIVWARCEACGATGWVRKHHVVYEQHCRAEGFPLFDPDNSMLVGVELTCRCHSRQHHRAAHGDSRIPRDLLPLPAVAFCYRMFGETKGRAYLARHYAPAREKQGRLIA